MKCCFCGHGRYWEVPNSIVVLLLETIEYLINYRNVDTFISGGMGEFDRLCESAIGELKKSYSHIKLFLYIPYMTKYLSNNMEYLHKKYDEIIYPELEQVYYKSAIQKRNRIMIDESDFMVAYVRNDKGGARQSYNYAKRSKKIKIINLVEYI